MCSRRDRSSELEVAAGNGEALRHEHRGPARTFSVAAFSQVHFNAVCLPQEQRACDAQTQLLSERPQQVVGTVDIFQGGVWIGCSVLVMGELWDGMI